MEMAKKAGNRKHIQALEEMGDYPPSNLVNGVRPEQVHKEIEYFTKNLDT